jgi:nucleoid DNA-binding protein
MRDEKSRDSAGRLADETDLRQAKAMEVFETIFDEIKSALQQGDAVPCGAIENGRVQAAARYVQS